MSSTLFPGFDYGCGAAYFTATPLRQAEARLCYWHDVLSRLRSDEGKIRSQGNNAAAQFADAKAGIIEAAYMVNDLSATPAHLETETA